ncbi:MAG TPA: hypothetical protein EYP36_02995, partial [Calditrichaeota bacterium]|nr:hypothetical protein [Calditrichota bacterium]
ITLEMGFPMFGNRNFFNFIFLSFFFYTALFSQSFTPKYDRIPSVIPQCALQDSYGFIWIGEQEGLVRYDGYNLKRYKQIPFDTTSLSNNFVTDVKEDKKGNLWIATRGGGLNYFDQRTGKFTHYRHDPEAPQSLGSNSINKILVNEDGSLWIGTWDNGFTYMSWDSAGNPKYKQYTNNTLPPHIPWYTILDMYKDKKGNLWIGSTGMGLQRLNIASGELKTYRHDPKNPASISYDFVSSICEDDSSNLWIGTGFLITKSGAGLNKFDPKTEKFTHYRQNPKDQRTLRSDIVTSLLIDRDKGLWIGTIGGGLQYIPVNELYKSQKPKFRRVSGGSATFIYEDRLGNIWNSLYGFDLLKYDYQQNQFHYLKHQRGNSNSLKKSPGYSLFLDKMQNLWIGHAQEGITKYNLQSKQYTHYAHEPEHPNSLSGNIIKAICADNEGRIWIGTANNGIDIFNPEDESFKHIKANPQDSTGLASNRIQHLLKRADGDIWVAFDKEGLQLYNAENKRFINYDIDPNSIEDELFYSICEDRSGRLWLGTSNAGLYGLSIKNRKIERIENFTYNPNDTLGLNNNVIGDIIEDNKNDVLWIATNCGLNRLDLQTGRVTHITERDGLPTNFLLTLLQDNAGKIWMTTSDGLSRYNPQNGKIINYGKADGLPHTHFGGGTKRNVKAPDGTLYFGAGGVIYFDPQEIKDNPNVPPIRLTDFKIFQESVNLDTAIQFKKNIILSHAQNAFSFEFTALNFTNPAKHQYAYKMEGFHDEWIYTGSQRTASFTNLDPGEYIFRAKGSNNHGLWNEQGTSIKITILPPWWRTNFAYAGYILFIAFALYALRRYDLKRQKLKHDLETEHEHSLKLQEIDRMKSRLFANISHEFRTPLTLILGPIEKLLANIQNSDRKNELNIMQRNARRLNRLINQLLDLSRLESGGMTLQISRENIVKLVRQYMQSFESLARQKGIYLQFQTDVDEIFAYVDRDKIEKIINNLLSNAFKFTGTGGKILVDVAIIPTTNPSREGNSIISLLGGDKGAGNDSAEFIQITISDTGIGIPADRTKKIFDRFYQIDDSQKREHEGTGIGLALTKELVELHHGKIKAESEVGKGTRFIISIPLGKEHFKEDDFVVSQIDHKILSEEAETYPGDIYAVAAADNKQ